ncbi:DNA-directed DNA polymerase [Tanacetum coccineum]
MRIAPEKKQKEPTYQLTLDILKQYSCYNPFLKITDFKVGAELFRKVPQITPKVPNQEFVEPPPHDDLVSFVKQLGYTDVYLESLRIDNRQTSAKRREQMPYPRFTNVVINHFLSKHNTITKRHDLFVNTIKYDSVLGKLKFVNKGEEHQKYGMSIPDSMMNDEIRNSAHYMTYLALSTNTKVSIPEVGKGKGKGVMVKKKVDADVQKEKKKDVVKKKDGVPRKKHSITITDNILPDPDEAAKLAKSISLTEAEHQDEELRLHETHASLVIGRELNLEVMTSNNVTFMALFIPLIMEYLCMTRSSTKELFMPFKDPERELRSSRKHFKTLSLDESRSPDFDLFSDQEEYSEEEVTDAMAETMEQYMSKTRADYGLGVARPKIEDKDNFELKGQFIKELHTNTYIGSDHEDVNEHIEKVLEIVDLFQIPNITIDQVMLRSFHISLTGVQEPDEKLYQAWERFKELLMKCPQHYLTEMQEVVLCYIRLDVPTRQILDSRRAILSKTAADAKVAIQEMAEYSQKWHNETSRTRSTKTLDGLAVIQAQLNNLGRKIKKVNEKVYAAQLGCELCKGPHYTKDCPLMKEGKTLEEAYYTQFGAPFQGGGYRATAPGFYQRNNANPSYQERRQSMEETLSKFMGESAKRHEENSNLIKEIRASTDAAIRNQGASIKTLEIQIGRLNNCYCEEKNGSYGPQFSEAYSYGASHIDKSIPQKEKDPGSFTLPCYINNVFFDNALADLGASVSVMPLSTYLNLGLGELAHTKLTVELADMIMKYLKGITVNVLVGIGKFVFPVDFIILDMPEDIKVPLILERPFLSTAHAKINVFKRKITLRVGEEKIIFKSVKPTSSLIKRVYMISLRERMELDLEVRLMGETLVLNRPLDPFFEDYIELNDLIVPIELRRDQVDDLMPTIEEGEVIEEFRARNDARLVSEIFGYPSDCDHDKKIYIDCAHNLKFACMIDFAVLEDMDAYRDEGMGDVIFGELFLREVDINAKRFEGMITIYNGNEDVTYQMLQDKIKDLENVVCKMGRSTDTLRLLTSEQKAFKDNLHKSGVGYNGPFVLSQAYAKIPKLYRASELLDIKEMKVRLEQNDVYLEKLRISNDLLNDQLLWKILKLQIQECGLSKRIIELEKNLSKSEAKSIAFEIALQHKSRGNNSLKTVQKENENFMASLQLENAHLKQTYKDLFESVQRKFSKKPQVFETPTSQKAFKSVDSSKKKPVLETPVSRSTPKVVRVRYKSDDPTRIGGICPWTFHQIELEVLRKDGVE